MRARAAIAQLGARFIRSGTTVLVHGYRRAAAGMPSTELCLRVQRAAAARYYLHSF